MKPKDIVEQLFENYDIDDTSDTEMELSNVVEHGTSDKTWPRVELSWELGTAGFYDYEEVAEGEDEPDNPIISDTTTKTLAIKAELVPIN